MDTILIEKQLEKVSPVIKRVFFSTEVAEEIAQIGEANGLLLDQINDLIEETGYMIIGLKASTDYVNIISKKLKIGEGVSRKISTEINEKVLKDIREEIQKITLSQEQESGVNQQISQPPQPEESLIKEAREKYREKAAQMPKDAPYTKPVLGPTPPPHLDPQIAHVEKAGEFTVEKPPAPSHSPQYNDSNLDKKKVLEHIEDRGDPYREPI